MKLIFDKFLFPFIIILLFSVSSCNKLNKEKFIIENKSAFVDPFIGTDFHGHTFPGATVPFGMVQVSPDTRLDGWDGCSAYHYSDSLLWGFSHTHLSGTGCGDYADILLLPINDFDSSDNSKKYFSLFDKSSEIAEAGYFEVFLKKYNIKVQLTATQRVGFHKYSYPDNKKYVFLDLEHRDKVLNSYLKQINDTLFVGLRESQAWANRQILYFAISFSEPMEIVLNNEDKRLFVIRAKNENSNVLMIKVALSATGEEAAINNMLNETNDWDFEKTKENAKKSWDKELSKILVSGGTKEQQRTFYSALYHCFIVPNIYSDFDKQFRGTDLKVHKADHDTYTVFSLWDTYRAAHPLYTITQEKRSLDFIKTFLDQYTCGGQLPVWELSANETMCMIGYHAVPPIVDAYFKGIDNFDKKIALKAMIDASNEDRLGKKEFRNLGYIPMDSEHESVSKNLEYSYDDWCIAQFAKDLGETKIYEEYIRRAQNYKNTFNAKNGFMHQKINAAFYLPFDPKEVNFNFTEANSWQYSFYVPHDILTFIEMHGGNEKFDAYIDSLFSQQAKCTGTNQADITGLIGQYAHGNEPSHHIAYLYNYCSKPWKTQRMVRRILNTLYTDKPDGLCGNEDCGQMSAWYVFSAMGFYPTNPANGIYDFGSPIFDTVTIQLENNKKFTVIAHNNSSENIYIQSVKLNNKNYDKLFITHKDIMNGGTLEFFMGNKSNQSYGQKKESVYKSKITDNIITPVPFTNNQARTFYDSITISLDCIDKNAEIFYTINDSTNSNPIKYLKPICLKADSEIRFFAKSKGKINSNVVSAKYRIIPYKKNVRIINKYAPQYAAGGDFALVDYIFGNDNFKNGAWQGYDNTDFEAIVDLLKVRKVNYISTNFLQDNKSWIFLPPKVEFFASKDGINFSKITDFTAKYNENETTVKIYNCKYNPKNLDARYIKVLAKNYGKLPKWHISAGENSWLFIDEIEIE